MNRFLKMNLIKKLKIKLISSRTLLSIVLILANSLVFAQQEFSRVPVYEVNYEYPNIDSIKSVLHRVRGYYESSSPQTIINEKTGKRITDFSKFDVNAVPSEGFSSEYSYTNGVVLSAFEYLDDVTGDKSFFANNVQFFNYVVDNLPYFEKNKSQIQKEKIGGWGRILNFHALDDCGSIGASLIKTYLKTKEEKYLPLIYRTAGFITNEHYRLPDGTITRNRPQYESIWADDLYMSVPFLANMGKLTGDKKYYDDAVKQVLQFSERLYIPEKELFDHGWSVTSGEYDSRFYWGRANGWALMTMVELLSILPEDFEGRDKVMHLYRSTIRGIANLQDGTGFWHNMLNKNDTFLETSCTAMFTFAIAKGINEGWISHVYGPIALTGWNATKSRVLPDGAVDGTCEATTFAHDNVYYANRGASIYATHGYGPVLYAGAEMIRLLQNDTIEIQKAKDNSINSTFHFIKKSEWPKK